MRIISGKYKGRALQVPKQGTRPTLSMLRESLFNICQSHIEEARFLDLFAGAGAVGLEALSRGAKEAYFVENNRQAVRIIKENIAFLGADKESIVYPMSVMDALAFFVKKEIRFDIIFADPPYNTGQSEQVLRFIDQNPILNEGGQFFLEESAFPELELKRLKLKSERKMASSRLQQWSLLQ